MFDIVGIYSSICTFAIWVTVEANIAMFASGSSKAFLTLTLYTKYVAFNTEGTSF